MTVTRPASSAFATREATQGLAALLPIGPEAKARIRVLVVDDEHTLRETCASVLQLEGRSEEHTSELQSPCNLVCRLLLEKKKKKLNRRQEPESRMTL